ADLGGEFGAGDRGQPAGSLLALLVFVIRHQQTPGQTHRLREGVDRIPAAEELVGQWWNGHRGRLGRRDIWLTTDGKLWHVRAREGGPDGREVRYDFDRAYEAREMVDRLIATAPGSWKDVTRLPSKPPPPATGVGGSDDGQ